MSRIATERCFQSHFVAGDICHAPASGGGRVTGESSSLLFRFAVRGKMKQGGVGTPALLSFELRRCVCLLLFVGKYFLCVGSRCEILSAGLRLVPHSLSSYSALEGTEENKGTVVELDQRGKFRASWQI